MAINVDLIKGAKNSLLEALAQSKKPLGLGGHFLLRDGACRAQADDTVNVERSRAHSSFMSATMDRWRKFDPRVAGTDVKRAGSLGSVDFVGG